VHSSALTGRTGEWGDAYTSVEWKVRKRAVREQAVFVRGDAVADLLRGVDLGRGALQGGDRVELRGGHGVLHPREELLV
jgi:hypothetical protein